MLDAKLFVDGTAVKVTPTAEGVVLTLPAVPTAIDTVVELRTK